MRQHLQGALEADDHVLLLAPVMVKSIRSRKPMSRCGP